MQHSRKLPLPLLVKVDIIQGLNVNQLGRDDKAKLCAEPFTT